MNTGMNSSKKIFGAVIGVISFVTFVGSTWRLATRPEEETATTSQAVDMGAVEAKRRAWDRIRRDLAKFSATPQSAYSNSPEVQEIEQYLASGGTIEGWRKDNLRQSESIKARANYFNHNVRIDVDTVSLKANCQHSMALNHHVSKILLAERKILLWQCAHSKTKMERQLTLNKISQNKAQILETLGWGLLASDRLQGLAFQEEDEAGNAR